MAGVSRSNIEATISTLRKNIAQAEEWFGPDCYQVGRMREFLERSEMHLRELDKSRRSAPSAM